jgi:hypothetical protein
MTGMASRSQKYFYLAFLIVAGWALPCVAFGAGPMLRSAGPVSGMRAAAAFPRGFQQPFFFGTTDGFGATEVTVQQFQSAPALQTPSRDNNRTYVPPQWVDGGFGVQISVPGHWIDAAPRR